MDAKIVIGGVVALGGIGVLLAWLMFSSVQPTAAELAAAQARADAGSATAPATPATP